MRPQNRPFVVEIKKTKRSGVPSAPTASAPPATWAEQFEQATALNESAARRAAEAVFSAQRPVPAPAAQPGAQAAEPEPSTVRKGRILLAIGAADPETRAAPGAEEDTRSRLRPPRQSTPGKAPEAPFAGLEPAGRATQPRAAEKQQPPSGQRHSPGTLSVQPKAAQAKPMEAKPLQAKPLQANAQSTETSRVAKVRVAKTPVAKTPVAKAPVKTPAASAPAALHRPEANREEQLGIEAVVAAAAPARKGGWRRGDTALGRGEKWKRRLPRALR
jgi:translation initiation factor IF-2